MVGDHPHHHPERGRPNKTLTKFAQAWSAIEAILFERTSELIKALKHSCGRMREEFHALEMELPEFTAVLDGMARNTYILLIVHDPTIGTMCLAQTRLACDDADVHVFRDSGVKDKHPSCAAEVRGAPS